jgi:hypothetical protein
VKSSTRRPSKALFIRFLPAAGITPTPALLHRGGIEGEGV